MQDQNYLLTVHHVEIWNLVYCVVCLIPMLYSLAELGGRMRAVRKRNLRWYDSRSWAHDLCAAWQQMQQSHSCTSCRQVHC